MSRTIYTKSFLIRPLHHLTFLKEGLHGHSCNLEISLDCPFNRENSKQLYDLVITPLDGRLINSLLESPTGESIVTWVFSEIKKSPLKTHLCGVALQETLNNRFEMRSTPL